jgi:hypothetical protein
MGEAPWLAAPKNQKPRNWRGLADERYVSVIACAPAAARLNVGVAVPNSGAWPKHLRAIGAEVNAGGRPACQAWGT